MADIKVILGNKKRTITPIVKKGEEKVSRTIDVHYVVTADAYNYILAQYEQMETYDPKTMITINDLPYRRIGGTESFHSNMTNAVRSYLEQTIRNPNKDITKLSEVVTLYENATIEMKRLLTL